MNNGPIDFDSPLGISKREWTKVLGVNLALLFIVYAVALIFTLCGSDVFLLNSNNAELQRIEETLRSIHVYPFVQMGFATIEEIIILCYTMKSKPKWWYPISFFAYIALTNVIFTNTLGYCPSWLNIANVLIFSLTIIAIYSIKERKGVLLRLLRFAIAIAIVILLNTMISFFRTKILDTGHIFDNASLFFLSVEYDLALTLTLVFLTLVLPFDRKGGKEQCPITQDVSGSSPTMKKWSPKNSQTKNNLSPKTKRKLLILKAKVIVIQTVALAVIASLPIFTGRSTEFSLMYVAFCLTRMVLGFSHSLHFKSELSCVTIGALTFWGLTYLSPSAEVSIIMSLVYGAGLALGFRLYWQLHDLIMYRKAAKTDRYAMFYTAFKGNIDPRHIRGVMRMRGFPEDEIKMVQMYMGKDKIEYIAKWLNMPLRSVDRMLTEIAEELYRKR